MAKGMGFKAAAASVAKKSGKSMAQANAIIGAGKANASPAAKKANPFLLKTSKKASPAKKALPAKKAAAKKANPFAKMAGGK